MPTIFEYAYHILTSPQLKDKLIPPPKDLIFPTTPHSYKVPDLPERSSRIRLTNEKTKIPRLEHLWDPVNVAISMHHFANHELMAIELFSWAILKFPQTSLNIQKAFLKTIQEEQIHFQLYQKRMQELGLEFGERPLNMIFWKQIPKMQTLEKFTAILSLSFEGANLDFSLIYKQAFQYHGDTQSAEIMEKIFRDEIKHVRRGLIVLKNHFKIIQNSSYTHQPKYISFWDYYTNLLEYPFTPRRAKAYYYIPETRKMAGLDDDFIKKLGEYTDEYSGRVHLASLEKVGIPSITIKIHDRIIKFQSPKLSSSNLDCAKEAQRVPE